MAALESYPNLKRLFDYSSGRKSRARERLKSDSQAGWYFGIISLQLPVSSYELLPEVATIEEVLEPPEESELLCALKEQHLFGAIGRYTHGIRHQIKMVAPGIEDQKLFNVAWWIICLLRIRTLAEFLVPVASNHSWSVIAGLEPKTCRVQFVEDVPRAKKLAESTIVQAADLKWVSENVYRFAQLVEVPCFYLAVESLSTHQHQASDRMMVASLWSGIEALFNIHSELSFRLASRIAVGTEPLGPGRKAAYKEIVKLYGTRSKAVHGAKLSPKQIHRHVLDVRAILSRILCRYIEEGEVFSEERIENEMFDISGNVPNA